MLRLPDLPQLSRTFSKQLMIAALSGMCVTLVSLRAIAQPAPPAPTETRVYALSHLEAEAAREQLTNSLGTTANAAQILADAQGNRLIVAAPASLHATISEKLTQIDVSTAPANVAQGTVTLKTLKATSLHARLEKVLGQGLPTKPDPTGQWLGFSVGMEEQETIYLWASQQTGEVHLHGTPDRIAAWKRILQTLDTPAPEGSKTRLVATTQEANAKAERALNILRTRPIVAQTTVTADTNETADQPVGPEADLNSLLGQVQIETVPGTDILMIRGNPEDVDRVMKVIREIEQLASVSEPRIDVVELQFVESQAIGTLLQRVFDDTLSSRYGYGSIVVVPLGRPNAVLLVGSPNTVKKAMEILQQLDQPGKKLTQYELFRLKHAQAEDAQSVLSDLFQTESSEGETSLGPQALVIPDTRTNSLIVRASPRDMDEIRELIKDIDREGSETVSELRVFKLKNVVAEDLEDVLQDAFEPDDSRDGANLSDLLQFTTIDAEGREQLQSGVLAGTRVIANSGANALVVSAPAKTMDLLEALITQLDQSPDVGIELRVFTVVNGDALSLSEMIGGIFGTAEDGGNDDQDLNALRIEVDERTNSIIAAGSKEDLITVEAILRTLDSADTRERQNRVYRLKNKFAEEVAFALQDWLNAERQVQGTAPGVASPFQQIEREVVIVPEVSSNSLIISATPRYYEQVIKLIEEIDKQDAMVMIQVLIAEISLGDLDEFGVELGLQDSVLFDRSLLGDIENTTQTVIEQVGGNNIQVEQQVLQTATITPGYNFGDPATGLGNSGSDLSLATAASVGGQALSSFGVNRISSEGGFGGLVLSASSNSINMLLRALQESRRLEVLSRPQIMALDNQPGSAFVGQIVPFITGSEISLAGTPQNTIQREQVGLNLQVVPRISPDNLVVMTVTATNDRLRPLNEGVPVAIAPNGDPILSPIVDSIAAQTTVSAVSGQTVVLSGLITKENNALHRRVPILADIPLLGDLFRYDSVSTERNELLIILTPHVVRSRVESEMLKQVESARMSWCLSDVVDMHGPAGLRSRSDPAGAAEAETIYPQAMPSEAMMPTLPAPANETYDPAYQP